MGGPNRRASLRVKREILPLGGLVEGGPNLDNRRREPDYKKQYKQGIYVNWRSMFIVRCTNFYFSLHDIDIDF